MKKLRTYRFDEATDKDIFTIKRIGRHPSETEAVRQGLKLAAEVLTEKELKSKDADS